ncbi:MAG: UbiA family prenyltransferase [archaeon]
MSLKHYFFLLRPINCFIAVIATLIGYLISLGFIDFGLEILLLMVAVFLICGAGQAVNDYFDLEVDKRKRRKELLIEKIGASKARTFIVILFSAGNLLALSVSLEAFFVAVVFSLLLFFYSFKMRYFKFVGNWVIGLSAGFTYVFGATITGNYSIVFFLAITAVFANVGREITKDLEDLNADKGLKKSLPMVLGERKAGLTVLIVYLLAIFFGFYPFFTGIIPSIWFACLVFISGIVFLFSFFQIMKNEYSFSKSLSKVGMIIALIAFLVSLF